MTYCLRELIRRSLLSAPCSLHTAQRAIATLCIVAATFVLASCSSNDSSDSSSSVLTMNLDPGVKTFEFARQLADEYQKQTGITVKLLRGPSDATERLSQYLQYLGAKSPDIDVYQIDVIWPAMLASHLVDLKDSFTTETEAFFPMIIKNNTVDGRLVAIPYYADAGMLYYRSDLLKKYGMSAPPKTWDELTTMAAQIQKGERAAGHGDFWGFVWQGKAYEGLTCNAVEWQASSGGGAILDDQGIVSVNNTGAITAFERAAGWVGTISPRGVTMYSEEEARQTFQAGNAAFMRNWPYAYSLLNGEDSPTRGKTAAAGLPGDVATLGGWQLAVSKYSTKQKQAVDLVRFMTSRSAQRRRTEHTSLLPTRVDLFDDEELGRSIPFLKTMKQTFLNAVPRPSTAAGEDYNEVSTYYFQYVHRVLTKRNSAEEAMAELNIILREILEGD